ncbi:MAG TPA: polysaccharide biosynthesis/export family protein [Vicinamibacterales bacterium]|nr:polysaccharide biosynthesis/export family protein [Vicinamibacterales bacterium]
MRLAVVVGAVGFVLLTSTGSLAQGAPPAPVSNGGVDPEEYRIGPEDALQVFVWKNETLSRAVAVRPDGKISLPLLGDIQAAGHTTVELRDTLVKRYTEFIAAPEISVIVNDVKSIKVSVIGEVPKAGRYELKSRTTVLDVLAIAGGFGQFASRSRIFVLRPETNKMKRIPFNYNKAVSEGGEQENFYLQPNDIVVVP